MAKKDDDFLAELRARRARIQNQQPVQGQERDEAETEPQDECVRPAPTPEPAPQLPQQVKDPQPAEPGPDTGPADQPEAWSVRLTDATANAIRAGSPMRAAGGWSDLGGDVTATVRDLESRLFTAPEQMSAAAHAACEKIACVVLDKLEARVEAVALAWFSVIETDWAPLFAEARFVDVTWQSASYLLNQALRPATAQAQSVVDAVGGLAGRMATAHPDLADPWKALARDLRGRHATIADTAEETGQPGSAAHVHARARAQAHARLAAMSSEERRRAAREAVIRRMSPKDAAAARAADTAAEDETKEKAAAAAAVTEWRTVAADLTQRYPLVRSIIARGHRPVIELLRTAGLGKKSAITRKNSDGSTTKVVSEELPTLAVIGEVEDGIELEFDPLPGQSVATWQTALGVLGVELGCPSLTVMQRGQRIVIATNDAPVPLPPASLIRPMPVPYDPIRGRSYLGQNGRGDDIWITWREKAGAVVGGTPGSGKTGSLLPLLAGLAGQAEVHIFDGKGEHDYDPVAGICRTFDISGEVDGPCADALARIEELRRARSAAIYAATGGQNFWSIPPDVREKLNLYPVFIVMDECQTWLDKKELSGKDELAIGADVERLLRRFVKKGRSAGMMTILATQKPEVESLPGAIRDMCTIKVCYQTTTDAQAKTVLAALPPAGPLRPTEIADGEFGRCVVKSGKSFDLVQSVFVDPKDITAALSGMNPVPDQMTVARGLISG
ncbi:hypothetical protein HF877_06180 [Rhodococcus sp. BL-253-APC-6A1W]|uniref:hypothetical protein n=1 Tax=Rhodococcus sp. BL-253-APC-6A1W TaxID=2725307 RepID=UPI00146A1E0F|nr:hypothetical protein [Rhodococcus sp. BL-253-APC-6A1W]NMD94991.1 hypothetical protein [Rhodococcus sp. BL-253-APC-6A1W]